MTLRLYETGGRLRAPHRWLDMKKFDVDHNFMFIAVFPSAWPPRAAIAKRSRQGPHRPLPGLEISGYTGPVARYSKPDACRRESQT